MPRLRKPKNEKELESIPLTEEVEIDIEAFAAEPKEEIKEEKEEKEPVIAAVEPPKEDESIALKRRIEELEKAEKTARDAIAAAQQRETEARRQAQEQREQLSRSREDATQAQYDSIVNALGASQAEAEAAKRDIQASITNQDTVALSEAYDRLSRANARIVQFEDGKANLEAKIEEAKREPPKREPPSDPLEAAIQHLPDQAKIWVRQHPDYWTDQRKNAKIQALHWDAIDAGHAAFSPGYFEFLEFGTGLKKKPEPTKTETDEEVTVVAAAPPTRETPSMSTGKPVSGKVKLTPEQREHARITGVSEVEYAKGVLELERRKKLGMYQN